MKKLFFLLMFMPAFAMADGWTTTELPADPVLGHKEPVTLTYYRCEGYRFAYYSNKPDQFCIIGDDILPVVVINNLHGILLNVGLYDADGKLIEVFEMWLDKQDNKERVVSTRDVEYMSQPVGQQRKVRKIFEHLKKGKGEVRFAVTPLLYGIFNSPMDFTVDPLPDYLKPHK